MPDGHGQLFGPVCQPGQQSGQLRILQHRLRSQPGVQPWDVQERMLCDADALQRKLRRYDQRQSELWRLRRRVHRRDGLCRGIVQVPVGTGSLRRRMRQLATKLQQLRRLRERMHGGHAMHRRQLRMPAADHRVRRCRQRHVCRYVVRSEQLRHLRNDVRDRDGLQRRYVRDGLPRRRDQLRRQVRRNVHEQRELRHLRQPLRRDPNLHRRRVQVRKYGCRPHADRVRHGLCRPSDEPARLRRVRQRVRWRPNLPIGRVQVPDGAHALRGSMRFSDDQPRLRSVRRHVHATAALSLGLRRNEHVQVRLQQGRTLHIRVLLKGREDEFAHNLRGDDSTAHAGDGLPAARARCFPKCGGEQNNRPNNGRESDQRHDNRSWMTGRVRMNSDGSVRLGFGKSRDELAERPLA